MSIFNTSARIILYGPLRDNNNPKIESDHLNARFFSEICFRKISCSDGNDDYTSILIQCGKLTLEKTSKIAQLYISLDFLVCSTYYLRKYLINMFLRTSQECIGFWTNHLIVSRITNPEFRSFITIWLVKKFEIKNSWNHLMNSSMVMNEILS